MSQASATPLLAQATTEEARDELAKFFRLAQMSDESPGMFSKFIDAEWHRLAETADYSDFCMKSAGRIVNHLPINGEGLVGWLGSYHDLFGTLTPSWFADENGVVDSSAYSQYLDTRIVRASWNCSPDTDPGVKNCPNGI